MKHLAWVVAGICLLIIAGAWALLAVTDSAEAPPNAMGASPVLPVARERSLTDLAPREALPPQLAAPIEAAAGQQVVTPAPVVLAPGMPAQASALPQYTAERTTLRAPVPPDPLIPPTMVVNPSRER